MSINKFDKLLSEVRKVERDVALSKVIGQAKKLVNQPTQENVFKLKFYLEELEFSRKKWRSSLSGKSHLYIKGSLKCQ